MTESAYRQVAGWPHYPAAMDFEMGSGVAVDDAGVVYLFTRDREHWAAHPLAMSAKMGKSSISMFTREGAFLGKWGPSDEPGFALGAHTLYIIDGHLWTVDRDGHVVKKYTMDGQLVLQLGTLGQYGASEYLFNGPTGVVVQANGNIVVTDGYWNSRVIWYSPTGEYIREIGGWGEGPGQFNSPHAIAQVPDGRLLVVDCPGGAYHPYMTVPGQIAPERFVSRPGATGRVQVFDPEGNFLEEWPHITPLSIAVKGDRIYASDDYNDLVVLDAQTFRELERHDDLAIYIHQLAVDDHGDLYTATVYPEHKGAPRGREGPSHHRWTREPALVASE